MLTNKWYKKFVLVALLKKELMIVLNGDKCNFIK